MTKKEKKKDLKEQSESFADILRGMFKKFTNKTELVKVKCKTEKAIITYRVGTTYWLNGDSETHKISVKITKLLCYIDYHQKQFETLLYKNSNKKEVKEMKDRLKGLLKEKNQLEDKLIKNIENTDYTQYEGDKWMLSKKEADQRLLDFLNPQQNGKTN